MVQFELDSFYFKFKNLLRAEKDAVLTFKSEAGRAFVTLSLDLGHVLSAEPDPPPCGPRNGPARTRRCEKRAAAREKLAAEEAAKDVESIEDVDDTTTDDKHAAEEANGNVKSTDNEEPTDAGKVEVQEIKEIAERATEPTEEATAGKVGLENIDDEFCTDAVYNSKSKETKSVASQTLERGPLPNSSSSKPGFDDEFGGGPLSRIWLATDLVFL